MSARASAVTKTDVTITLPRTAVVAKTRNETAIVVPLSDAVSIYHALKDLLVERDASA